MAKSSSKAGSTARGLHISARKMSMFAKRSEALTGYARNLPGALDLGALAAEVDRPASFSSTL